MDLSDLPTEFHAAYHSIQPFETLYLLKFGTKPAKETEDYAKDNAVELVRGMSFIS
jgi:hypothetical protein